VSTYNAYPPFGIIDLSPEPPAPPHGPAEGTGDDQGDHETPTPAPTATASPSPSPSASAGPSAPASSDEAPSMFPTEPATAEPASALPQTSGVDGWLAFTFVLVAVLAIAGGVLMRRHARRLGHH
jgi:hypothetical protein